MPRFKTDDYSDLMLHSEREADEEAARKRAKDKYMVQEEPYMLNSAGDVVFLHNERAMEKLFGKLPH